MKRFVSSLLLLSLSAFEIVYSQSASIDKAKFFSDTSVINANITTNLGKLFSLRNKEGYIFPATFSFTLPDGTKLSDEMQLEVRGHFRRGYCYIPPLKLIFKNNKASVLHSLKSLKLVSECKISAENEQYLLKEFVIYKIYNLITDLSFRVRLLNLNLQDSSGKKKTITEHAFLMEDVKDLAKRNNCALWEKGHMHPESTNRRQMTIVALFEYMIGNTDWGVSADHNTRLIVAKDDSLTRPYVIPYDFDYSGFVNTDYAVPDEKLDIQNVRQRLYRGFPRTIAELNEVLDIFKRKKESIYGVINHFALLSGRSKKDLTDYLDDFYKLINSPNEVKSTFIDNARKE
jgi:hypothetical protein